MAPSGVAEALCLLLTVYGWVLLAHVVLSWLTLARRAPTSGVLGTIASAVDALVRPVLAPLRSMMRPVRVGGVGIDLSVIVAFVVLQVLMTVVC